MTLAPNPFASRAFTASLRPTPCRALTAVVSSPTTMHLSRMQSSSLTHLQVSSRYASSLRPRSHSNSQTIPHTRSSHARRRFDTASKLYECILHHLALPPSAPTRARTPQPSARQRLVPSDAPPLAAQGPQSAPKTTSTAPGGSARPPGTLPRGALSTRPFAYGASSPRPPTPTRRQHSPRFRNTRCSVANPDCAREGTDKYGPDIAADFVRRLGVPSSSTTNVPYHPPTRSKISTLPRQNSNTSTTSSTNNGSPPT